MEKVTCPECNTKNNLNPQKHKFRPKYCTNCKAVIANATPKLRISIFQRRKKERKEATRVRFIDRLVASGEHVSSALKKLTKIFKGEE